MASNYSDSLHKTIQITTYFRLSARYSLSTEYEMQISLTLVRNCCVIMCVTKIYQITNFHGLHKSS